MKKMLVVLLGIMLILAVTSCGENAKPTDNSSNTSTEDNKTETEKKKEESSEKTQEQGTISIDLDSIPEAQEYNPFYGTEINGMTKENLETFTMQNFLDGIGSKKNEEGDNIISVRFSNEKVLNEDLKGIFVIDKEDSEALKNGFNPEKVHTFFIYKNSQGKLRKMSFTVNNSANSTNSVEARSGFDDSSLDNLFVDYGQTYLESFVIYNK